MNDAEIKMNDLLGVDADLFEIWIKLRNPLVSRKDIGELQDRLAKIHNELVRIMAKDHWMTEEEINGLCNHFIAKRSLNR